MKTENVLKKGILFCLIAGIAFGGQWPVAGNALKSIDPFFFTLIRYLIVAVVLSVILLLAEGPKSFKVDGKFKLVWFLGTMAFCAYNFLVFAGQKMAGEKGAILGSLLMALIPMVSILVVWIYKKEKPANVTLFLVGVSLIGVILVITKGNIQTFISNFYNVVPALLMLLSVFAWVIYTIGGSGFINWSSLRFTTLSCIYGNVSSIIVISLLVYADKVSIPTLGQVIDIKWGMLYMSLVAGVIGVFAWNIGNKILKPINGSLFMNLVPIVTFVISVSLGYQLSLVEVIGAILTIAAIIINNLYQRKLLLNIVIENDKEQVKNA